MLTLPKTHNKVFDKRRCSFERNPLTNPLNSKNVLKTPSKKAQSETKDSP